MVPQLFTSVFSDVLTLSELVTTLFHEPSVVLHVWLCSGGSCFRLLQPGCPKCLAVCKALKKVGEGVRQDECSVSSFKKEFQI